MNSIHALQTLPPDFIRRLHQLIPTKFLDSVYTGLTQKRPTSFRVNTLKTSGGLLVPALETKGFSVSQASWLKEAYILTKGTLRSLTDTQEYRQGFAYVQSLSSMVPPLALGPKPGQRVLDLTAAPGSKTTQMAAIMQNSGKIIANDTSRLRTYRLRANLDTQGVTNTTIHSLDGRSLWKTYPEYFDMTLADVPCSMEGRFCVSESESYDSWSLKKVRDMSMLQRWLLRSAVSATKPGGFIVYSTCTLSPEENEGVIDWMLNKDKGIVTLEDIRVDGLTAHQGLTRFGDRTYNEQLRKTLRIYPSETMEGFFIARLRKVASMVPATSHLHGPMKTVFHHGAKKTAKRFIVSPKRGHKRVI